LIIAFITPAVLVGMMIPDSFAGERERHTMGTLLASRLPDQAILIGKMAIPVMVGWGVALLFTFLSLVVVNIAHGQGELLYYTADITVGIFVISFLVATTMAGGGVVTSLRAESAQAAAQKLMTLILVPAMIIQIVPLLFMDQLRALIVNIDRTQFMIALMILFAFVDMILFVTAVIRFQRSKMYLDM
jgi:ABC-2 type transport system permease protein